jgi:hypothetical protein
MAWCSSHEVIFCNSPCGVVVDFPMTTKADRQKIFNIVQLVSDSSGFVVDLGGWPSVANFAFGMLLQVLNPNRPIKRTHPPALG